MRTRGDSYDWVADWSAFQNCHISINPISNLSFPSKSSFPPSSYYFWEFYFFSVAFIHFQYVSRCINGANMQTLPKAQRTRGLSSSYQSNFFRSYHKFLHKSWSNIFRISTKHQIQSLNQISAFRQNVNLKILTKPSFTISTKIELHNHNQASYQ